MISVYRQNDTLVESFLLTLYIINIKLVKNSQDERALGGLLRALRD